MQRVLEALHQGDYDTAFETLVRILAFAQGEAAKEASLLLAEAYTLYGEGGLEGAYRALEEGREAYPDLEVHPRYRALLAELRALEGASEGEVKSLLIENSDPQAQYHQAQALLYLGLPEEALTILERLLQEDGALPDFLAWRAHALLGKAYERLGQPGEAALAYREAAHGAVGLERYWNLLDAAAMFVEAGAGEEALEVLAEAGENLSDPALEDPEDAATRAYLEARAHLLLGNPNRALEAIAQALELEKQGAEPAHGTPLVQGQALMQLGQYEAAIQAFREAAARAEDTDRTYALHELGVASLEGGHVAEAETYLREVVRDPDYGYLGEAWGDLAETLYRQSRYDEARQAALQAIALEARPAGHLILGHLAYDLLNLEEALEHYEIAAQEAPEGSRDWVSANEMVVDVLAQMGFVRPQEIVARAEALMPLLAESDDWRDTLQGYIERARAMLGGRTLN
ncbi:MAG: Tfp pilus assembly protein PilF [Meiothermus sp.]